MTQKMVTVPVCSKCAERAVWAKTLCNPCYQAAYRERPEVKAKKAAYRERPEVKAKMAAYRERPEVKAKMAAYFQRPEVKAKMAAYQATRYARIKRALALLDWQESR